MPPIPPEGGWPLTREDLRPKAEMIKGAEDLPKYYNIREKYPNCEPGVLDQKTCGSCWAFSSAGMLQDRFCMQSEGQIHLDFSP